MTLEKQKIKSLIFAPLLLLAFANLNAQDISYTRGIGKYPGNIAEYHGPRLRVDNTYHNLALMHTAIASGSEDYNLTAQLVTDGIVSNVMPPSVNVSIDGKQLSLRDKEKTFDGNIHSYNTLGGEESNIQFDWRSMAIRSSRLKLNAIVVYNPKLAIHGYKITVLSSKDGRKWKQIGRVLSKAGLPGVATKQEMSSDPNKQESVELLPMRKVHIEIPVTNGEYRHLRIAVNMPGCAYWRFYESIFTDDETGMLPSYKFGSAWVSKKILSKQDASEKQWISIDFGSPAKFDKVILHWLQKPLKGIIQISDDNSSWKDLMPLPQSKSLVDTIPCNGNARYIRLLMTKASKARQYALSECQVLGFGGLTPDDNNWQLCRKGDNHWIPATVPGTVLASYLNIQAIPDNTSSNNMRQISESYFNSDFIYRSQFLFNRDINTKEHIFLNCDGINWKSLIYINGKEAGRTSGAFQRARIDITPYLLKGKNQLIIQVRNNDHIGAVKEKNLESTDLNGGVIAAGSPTFMASVGWDWITSTPGRDVGIWNNMYLSSTTGPHLSDPLVTTQLNLPDTLATVTPAVKVINDLNASLTADIQGWIGDIRFSKTITLAPKEVRQVVFSPEQYPQLVNRKLRLWWPNGYGQPYLYDAGFSVNTDTLKYKAGIRQMAYTDIDTKTKIYINGKRFIPLGGNWGFPEINLNYRAREYDAAVKYHRDMNFNMIRNWVCQVGDQEFYDACDRYGIVVWQDFWLANPWDGPDPYDESMFIRNSSDLVSKIRKHPCIGIYVGRNEGYPPKSIDTQLRRIIKEEHPQLGYISSSADDGVSGHGPYRTMPSNNWYFVRKSPKLHSERGVPNIPSCESMRRMLANDDLWPINDGWGQHDFTLGGAQNCSTFIDMMDKYFGKAQSLQQFTQWAQWINYDTHRAMFENAQQERMGLLMWMSHPCWPSTVWQTYDYYFEPTAAYFAIKKACEPLHVMYNPITDSIQVVDVAKGFHRFTATADYFDINGALVAHDEKILSIDNDNTKNILRKRDLSHIKDSVYFIRLQLFERNKLISSNTYVLGKEENHLKALLNLPKVKIESHLKILQTGNECKARVIVNNTSKSPALMIRLNLKGDDNEQILPVIYGDNYFHLMPGESKSIDISWKAEDTRGAKPVIDVTGFNLE